MTPLSEFEWGPYEASKDQRFSDHWVNTDYVEACLQRKYWIISGEKGSGKTAVSRALAELYRKDSFAISVIDFDDLSFLQIYQRVSQLYLATRHSPARLLTHYWQYCLFVELVSACYRTDQNRYGDIYFSIPKAIRNQAVPTDRLLQLVDHAIGMVNRFIGGGTAVPEKPAARENISTELIQQISSFPLNRQYELTQKSFFERLADNDHRIVIILDGFDLLKNDLADPTSIQTMFAALVSAIQKMDSSRSLPDQVEIKAFIPHDQYLSTGLRDADKISEIHTQIRWTEETLKSLVSKRLRAQKNVGGLSFGHIWREVFPLRIRNSHYGIEEDSFSYLVRHTMMRPRQMQMHLTELANSQKGSNIDPSTVPRIIRESCENMTRFFISEYKITVPELPNLFRALRKQENVMTFDKLQSIILSAASDFGHDRQKLDIEKFVNRFYAIGIFGVLREEGKSEDHDDGYCPKIRKTRPRYYFQFYYKKHVDDIYNHLDRDDLVAIHPIFFDYSSMTAHPDYVVG